MDLIYEPKVTLLAKPTFFEPEHLPIEWADPEGEGPASDGERLVEYAGRLCYMSQHNPARRSTDDYLRHVLSQGHGSIFEHANYTFLIEDVSRTLTHELVRHRAGFAYSQLSQRFVAGGRLAFVVPPAIEDDPRAIGQLEHACSIAESDYVILMMAMGDDVKGKQRKEAARAVLPNCTATKIVVTANLRAWRGFIELRATAGADQEIRRLAMKLYYHLSNECPGAFIDYTVVCLEGAAKSAAYGITATHRKV